MNSLSPVYSPVTFVFAAAALGCSLGALASLLDAHLQRPRAAARRIRAHLPPATGRLTAGGRIAPTGQVSCVVGRLETLLSQAGVSVDARALLCGLAAGGVVTCVLLLGATGLWPVAVAGGVAAPVLACWIYIARQREAARRRLVDQVPAAFEAISNAMRAGSTLTQAIAQAADELPAPMAGLLSTATALYRVGRPLEDALLDLQKHVGLPVMEFAVSAILVNRQTGGSLAPLLLDAADLVREDLRLQRDLQAATAQAHLSAQLVGLLPLLLLGALAALNPGSLEPFFASPAGVLMLLLAGLLDATGFVFVVRASRVEF